MSNYSQLAPISIAEPATMEEVEDMFNNSNIILTQEHQLVCIKKYLDKIKSGQKTVRFC